MDDLTKIKKAELEVWEKQVALRAELPHLYGWKMYKWMRAFFESTNRDNLICCANQTGKSSIMIRKAIHWATEKSLWEKLWPTTPRQFWYFYPSLKVATIEVKKKWIPEFLPRGLQQISEKYGWRLEIKAAEVQAIHFNSGVSIYFKSYSMDPQDIQTASVHMVCLDEEPPSELLAEIHMRMIATQGHFHAVFTPTLGQDEWRRAFEEIGKKYETYKTAFKQQVSMFDCLYYEDNSRSPWTLEEIQRAMNACKSDEQVQRRIYGRFVNDEGMKYPSFNRTRNMTSDRSWPSEWEIYAGVDIGGGGECHKSAITLVAVNPEHTRGKVIKGWRGDEGPTTASDVAKKLTQMSRGMMLQRVFYDFACVDFFNIAQGMNINVEPAEKSHSVGEQVLNVLFKNGLLQIVDDPDLEPLVSELLTLKVMTKKVKAKDDAADSLRYAVSKVWWDWSVIGEKPILKEEKPKTEIDERREFVGLETRQEQSQGFEFDEYNDLLDVRDYEW